MMTHSDRFIACGMYAFTEAQQEAWQGLFEHFFELSGCAPGQVSLKFEHGSEVLRQPGLWFGHTCGYPLVSHLKDDFSPFCVALFDVPGTSGGLYSSRIIVAADADIQSLAGCRGRVAAMNNSDSNSGMNVLRHAVATIHGGGPFFSSVVTSGGHLNSLEAVAEGAADVAAIDCVSFQLIADWQPRLIERVRVIGDSVKTCGLPFVIPRAADASDIGAITDRLNEAFESSTPEIGDRLHLTGFQAVTLDDYQGIVDVERFAFGRGYPTLI
jgi:ABC-type phosphate/phosphonate transport system substrate-binding protein